MKPGALIAWNLRRLRVAKGVSQEALATDADVDRAYMSRLERGLENPTVELLARVAKALGIGLQDFFRAPGKNEAAPKPLSAGRRPGKTKRR